MQEADTDGLMDGTRCNSRGRAWRIRVVPDAAGLHWPGTLCAHGHGCAVVVARHLLAADALSQVGSAAGMADGDLRAGWHGGFRSGLMGEIGTRHLHAPCSSRYEQDGSRWCRRAQWEGLLGVGAALAHGGPGGVPLLEASAVGFGVQRSAAIHRPVSGAVGCWAPACACAAAVRLRARERRLRSAGVMAGTVRSFSRWASRAAA